MHCYVLGWKVMASVEGSSQTATGSGSSGSDVHADAHPNAPLSAVNENSVHKADAEARRMFINCIF